MLTEERYEVVLNLLEKKKSITVAEVKELLHTSESTVRRDFTVLHNAGKLVKVFGGAVRTDHAVTSKEPTVAQKLEVKKEQKQLIGRYAASLIEPEDFIFLDAGTTTGCMLSFIKEYNATYVTNAVAHAKVLAGAGLRVLLVGGELKGTTEAVVGSQAILTLQGYHFTKGFFGTNGISKKAGYTTPDASEAQVKRVALEQSQKRYMLADTSKFGNISSITFASFDMAEILTEEMPSGIYGQCQNIFSVGG